MGYQEDVVEMCQAVQEVDVASGTVGVDGEPSGVDHQSEGCLVTCVMTVELSEQPVGDFLRRTPAKKRVVKVVQI